MERICPFLALSGDGRTVVDGYDPDHRCRATHPPQELERAQQVGVCLDIAHRRCDRFVAALQERSATGADMPLPAADSVYAHTRLVLAPERQRARRLGAMRAGVNPAARRWAVGGALATVGIAAVASGVAGALGSLGDVMGATPAPSATAQGTASGAPSPVILASPRATPPPTQTPTPQPTSVTTPAPSTVASTAPEARTYIVQAGDTLSAIAGRFGLTVADIRAANGLSGDVITVGQVLVIP